MHMSRGRVAQRRRVLSGVAASDPLPVLPAAHHPPVASGPPEYSSALELTPHGLPPAPTAARELSQRRVNYGVSTATERPPPVVPQGPRPRLLKRVFRRILAVLRRRNQVCLLGHLVARLSHLIASIQGNVMRLEARKHALAASNKMR